MDEQAKDSADLAINVAEILATDLAIPLARDVAVPLLNLTINSLSSKGGKVSAIANIRHSVLSH